LSVLGLDPNSVRCTITSPPYFDLKTYAREDPKEIGTGQTLEAYRESMRQVFAQVLALTREDGVLWLVVDTLRDRRSRSEGLAEIMPLPFDLAKDAQEIGWRFQDVIIWKKDKTLPYSGQGKLRNLIEYVLFFTRSGEFLHRPYRCAARHMPGARWMAGWPERYHPLGRRPSNMWPFKLETQGMWKHAERRHACPFPQDLVARCIELTTDDGDLVLDPFAGIGTVVAQAVAMGRQGVGLELNPENVETFHEHVLPEFQRRWEVGAQRRQREREDQIAEAQLILRLRLLKAGKEMLRAIQHIARSRPARDPAGNVCSVAALQGQQLGRDIDIDEGRVGRAGGRLLLISERGRSQALLADAQGELQSSIFTSLGLELSVEVIAPSHLAEHVELSKLQEFGLSRHGAYTAPIKQPLFDSLPPLITDVHLESPISGEEHSELERVRDKAERELLVCELSTGRPHAEVAQRIGISQATLHDLLEKHGLRKKPTSFAISLPGQMTLDAASVHQ
jgi:DNA modification methylase